jgi:malonyl-CoA/methylmalonyl-CoA synthetase
MHAFFPAVERASGDLALQFPRASLTWGELRAAALDVADDIRGCERVAVWAEPSIETAIAVIGALIAGVTVVPINPSIGRVELAHVLDECALDAVLAGREVSLPEALASRGVRAIRGDAERAERRSRSHQGGERAMPAAPDADAPALIIYTSGTTGLPKGAVLPYRAIAADIDGLAHVWQWTARDTLVHALPLFHVHGLVLGVLGPARVGSRLVHVERFSPDAIASSLSAFDTTMLFGVPTMYHRLADAAERDTRIADALRRARLLISGSAPLAPHDRDRLYRATGRRVIERYGLTETLIVCAMPPERGDTTTGVGLPIPGVEMRLVDEFGSVISSGGARAQAAAAGTSAARVDEPGDIGEIEIRGATVFSGYLNRPDATAQVLRDGWFRTGDTATRDEDGHYRIIGRTALDVIKTGGFKVGAGEIEDVLRGRHEVADVAVTGEADPDLGQRIVAWIVPRAGCTPSPAALEAHVAEALTPHKRPRVIHFLDDLPRNSMGKLEKRKLAPAPTADQLSKATSHD